MHSMQSDATVTRAFNPGLLTTPALVVATQGIARQRAAIVAGLRDSVKEFTDNSDVSSKDGGSE